MTQSSNPPVVPAPIAPRKVTQEARQITYHTKTRIVPGFSHSAAERGRGRHPAKAAILAGFRDENAGWRSHLPRVAPQARPCYPDPIWRP